METPCILAVIQNDLPLICQLRAAWEEAGCGKLRVARNTEEAVFYMRGVGVYGNRASFPIPNLVVLDCSNWNGSDLEVLSWLRDTEEFRRLPVALLCAENHPISEAMRALDHSCFFVDRGRLEELVRAGVWLSGFPSYPAPTERGGTPRIQV